eukprot:GILJ01010106.1.p1 GENE.GILJ01010106.1~~GILJ01010106.1.p1  ORF type:complete len:574 (+),score=73.87 GILJ01010106.1:85-1722(+)
MLDSAPLLRRSSSKTRTLSPSFVRFTCQICRSDTKVCSNVEELSSGLKKYIKDRYPSMRLSSVCQKCIDVLRIDYLQSAITLDHHEYADLQKKVLQSLEDHEVMAANLDKQFERPSTFGERSADKVAEFGGSWKFIIIFIAFILAWSAANIIFPASWDPYPFILLNLVLSMVASVQAPIIMMSQNRVDEKDRIRSEYDHKVNLKAELSLRHLHAKFDKLIEQKWQRLLDMQYLQINMLKQMTLAHEPLQQIQLWSQEVEVDPFYEWLINLNSGQQEDSSIVFQHWHTNGDNFLGRVQGIQFSTDFDRKVAFEVAFSNQPNVILDAIFSGNHIVTLRNCMDSPHLRAIGTISAIRVNFLNGRSASWNNGEIPSRQPSESMFEGNGSTRKLSELWLSPIRSIIIAYTPGRFFSEVTVERGTQLHLSTVTFTCSQPTAEHEVVRLMQGTDLKLRNTHFSPRMALADAVKWREIAHYIPDDETGLAGRHTVDVAVVLEGGHKYAFFASSGRAIISGLIRKHAPHVDNLSASGVFNEPRPDLGLGRSAPH